MGETSQKLTAVYPVFASVMDLWYWRLAGDGLGNCFYSYFHAVVLAEQRGAKIVAPAWACVRLGPLLRGESSKRFYIRMFRPYPGDIRGFRKFLLMLSVRRERVTVDLDGTTQPAIVAGALNKVRCRKFTFHGLHPHRQSIRQRLLGIVTHAVPAGHAWGNGGYIAIHVRLGDFAKSHDPKALLSGKANQRIPLSWYVNVVRALRSRYPDKYLHVFSDGKEAELRELIDLGAKLYRSGSDVVDLLAMGGASILVGSNSTYSRWAAFLGNMPSVWLKREVQEEKPSAHGTPIAYLPIAATSDEMSREFAHAFAS